MQINLDLVDRDGAIREAAEEVAGDRRLDFLRKGAIGSGALFGGAALVGAVPGVALAAGKGRGRPPKSFGKGDIGILNYALTLEYLERAFYNEATTRNAAGSNAQLAGYLAVVTADERAHVDFLKSALGSKAVAEPKFNFGDATSPAKFAATSQVLENAGVAAYLGQAGNIAAPKILGAAASIVTVEARHAGAIGVINDPSGTGLSPAAFDKGATAQSILATVKGTGFIVG